MKGLGSKVSDCIKEKKSHTYSKFPLGKLHVGEGHTILKERLTQPIFPPLLVLTTISSANHLQKPYCIIFISL